MGKIAGYFKTKKFGFYFVLITIVLVIAGLVVAGICIGNSEFNSFLNWTSFYLMVALVVVDLLLFLIKKDQFTPIINFILGLVSTCFFVNSCYNYVASVSQGIDLTEFSINFIIYAVCSLGTLAFSIATIFMPIEKKQ